MLTHRQLPELAAWQSQVGPLGILLEFLNVEEETVVVMDPDCKFPESRKSMESNDLERYLENVSLLKQVSDDGLALPNKLQ